MRPSALLVSLLALLVSSSALAIPPKLPGGNCTEEENTCPKNTTCVRSTGILGQNPKPIISCVRRCSPRSHNACPTGEECVSVSDGPGYICKISHRKQKPTGTTPASTASPANGATGTAAQPAPDGGAAATPANATLPTPANGTPAPPTGTTPPPSTLPKKSASQAK